MYSGQGRYIYRYLDDIFIVADTMELCNMPVALLVVQSARRCWSCNHIGAPQNPAKRRTCGSFCRWWRPKAMAADLQVP